MKRGFTLLELIVVIIIIGVLTSLALPRLLNMIEFSRSAEAFTSIASIRSAMERCYLLSNNDYSQCTSGILFDFAKLGIEDPGLAPNAHFDYYTQAEADHYGIIAERNTFEDKTENAGEVIGLMVDYGVNSQIYECGSGIFKNIGIGENELCYSW